jgi:hypothetical protein
MSLFHVTLPLLLELHCQSSTMAKSANPVEAFRREQKKKELKKHRLERQKDKQAKLSVLDPAELQAQLKALERQAAANPADGPTRKRKQELEDTLRAVVKRRTEQQEEENKRQADAPPPPPKVKDLALCGCSWGSR